MKERERGAATQREGVTATATGTVGATATEFSRQFRRASG